jgi:hypothetical protein
LEEVMVNTSSQKPCECGCGEYPKDPTSRFLPGHDLRKAYRDSTNVAPLPKWVPDFLKHWGNLRIQQANDSRQRASAHEAKEAKALFLELAERYEKCGRELLRIAQQGSDEEMENAYHDIAHGAPKTVIF